MNKYKDVIGIIGGMGSFSTLYFFERFLKLFKAEEEYDRPRIIIDNYCTLPNKVKAFLYNEKREELLHSLIVDLDHLNKLGCTKSIILCNTTHIFIDEIFRNRPDLSNGFIDMLECLNEQLLKDRVEEVLIWGTNNTKKVGVYEKYLGKNNIKTMYCSDEIQLILNEIMLAGEHGMYNESIENLCIRLSDAYIDQNMSIVLGCTELSLINSKFKFDKYIKVYDPVDIVLFKLFHEIK